MAGRCRNANVMLMGGEAQKSRNHVGSPMLAESVPPRSATEMMRGAKVASEWQLRCRVNAGPKLVAQTDRYDAKWKKSGSPGT